MNISSKMKNRIVLVMWVLSFLLVFIARSFEFTLAQAAVEIFVSSFVIGLIVVSVHLMIQDK